MFAKVLTTAMITALGSLFAYSLATTVVVGVSSSFNQTAELLEAAGRR